MRISLRRPPSRASMACASTSAWPPAEEVERCANAWELMSNAERREFCSLKGDSSVVYLKVAIWVVSVKLKDDGTPLSAEDILEQQAQFRLRDLEWQLESPRRLLLSTEFCEQDDAVAFMLSLCARDAEECADILRAASNGEASADPEKNTMLSGRCSTWLRLAKELFTLVMAGMLLRLRRRDVRVNSCLSCVAQALETPPRAPLRSWPSKSLALDLGKEWQRMPAEARVRATTLRENSFWFVQACDLAVYGNVLETLRRRGIGDAENALVRSRERSRLFSQLQIGDDDTLQLSTTFVAKPDALRLLLSLSVKRASDKDALLALAQERGYEEAIKAGDAFLCSDGSASWVDIERVIATLMLAGLERRLAAQEAMYRAQQEDAARAAATRASAAARRKEKAREAKAALRSESERQRRRAEQEQAERNAVEAARLWAERDRARAEQEIAERDRARAEQEIAERERTPSEKQAESAREEEEEGARTEADRHLEEAHLARVQVLRARSEARRARVEERRTKAEAERLEAEAAARVEDEAARSHAEEARLQVEAAHLRSQERANLASLLSKLDCEGIVPWRVKNTFVDVDFSGMEKVAGLRVYAQDW